jgi:predicted  nucleic acid-binding Zn-ribbon protein
MIRPKDPDRVRADALRRGAEKQLAGCATCAEEYFALARLHGAGEEEIRGALAEARRVSEAAHRQSP